MGDGAISFGDPYTPAATLAAVAAALACHPHNNADGRGAMGVTPFAADNLQQPLTHTHMGDNEAGCAGGAFWPLHAPAWPMQNVGGADAPPPCPPTLTAEEEEAALADLMCDECDFQTPTHSPGGLPGFTEQAGQDRF